jgi:hypothetical protein
MIVKKEYVETSKNRLYVLRITKYLLFGIIPLYTHIIRVNA